MACFTCGNIIANKYELWERLCATKTMDEAFDEIGFLKDDYCCRRMFMSHVDLMPVLLAYSNNPGERVQATENDEVSEIELKIQKKKYTLVDSDDDDLAEDECIENVEIEVPVEEDTVETDTETEYSSEITTTESESDWDDDNSENEKTESEEEVDDPIEETQDWGGADD